LAQNSFFLTQAIIRGFEKLGKRIPEPTDRTATGTAPNSEQIWFRQIAPQAAQPANLLRRSFLNNVYAKEPNQVARAVKLTSEYRASLNRGLAIATPRAIYAWQQSYVDATFEVDERKIPVRICEAIAE
jgi:hypothetical protein